MNPLRDFLIMLAIVILGILATTIYGNARDLTIYETFRGTNVPDLSRPSAIVDTRTGTVYRTFPGTRVPDYSRPEGRVEQPHPGMRVRPLRVPQINSGWEINY